MDCANQDYEGLLAALGVNCKKSGKLMSGTCPVHGGDNPTAFNYYYDGFEIGGVWFCRSHHCHTKYAKNIVGLVRGILSHQKQYEVDFIEAIDWLLDFCNFKSIEEIKLPSQEEQQRRNLTQSFRRINITRNESKDGWTQQWFRSRYPIPSSYFLVRGFSEKILDKYDVGWSEKIQRSIVPVYNDDGQFIVGFTARSIFDKCEKCKCFHNKIQPCPTTERYFEYSKWKNSKGFEASHYLYNYWFAKEHIRKTNTAIIVEGPGDVWKLEEQSIHISLALFGTELTDQQRIILDRSGAMSIIVMLDNDEAGIKAAKNIKKQLSRCYRLYFPKIQAKDVGDLHEDLITSDIKPLIKKVQQ